MVAVNVVRVVVEVEVVTEVTVGWGIPVTKVTTTVEVMEVTSVVLVAFTMVLTCWVLYVVDVDSGGVMVMTGVVVMV